LIPSVDKPCIKKCCLTEDNVCTGCFRTLDDMRIWHTSSRHEKIKMLSLAQKRQDEYKIT
jgi:predicted Fe-S protein YdhL (DUF1289 family)